MKKVKPIISLVLCTIIISTFLSQDIAAENNKTEEYTLYTYQSDYVPAKYEPTEGIYLGAYVLQDVAINMDMGNFNSLLGKEHASYFKYVGYGQPFPTLWVEEVKAVGAVPHIAFEPNNGLDQVKDDEYLRNFAIEAKKADVPIFLRYASEMNGDWANYSGDTKEYIEKWRIVYDVMKEEAPNVAMVWTVFTFPEYTIDKYYPGDDYVDWVGVNIYNVMYHNDNIKDRADHEDPLNLLDYVYNTYSYKKPIQISEFGVTHYSTTDNQYYIDFKKEKLTRMYANLPEKYPRVKSIYYFDVNNLVNAPEGRKINDYSLTNNDEIINTYKNLINNDSYLTEVVKEEELHEQELLSYRGKLFVDNGKMYADVDFFTNYLGMTVEVNKDYAVINGIKFPITHKTMDRKMLGYQWKVKGISVRDVANEFGYNIYYDSATKSTYIYK